jgi:Cu2+-exporting ATPase
VEWQGAEWVKPLVLALESGSSHPIAAGFRRAWPDMSVPHVERATHVVGGGIEGVMDGRYVVVGSPAFVRARVARTDAPELQPLDDTLTPVLVAVDGAIVAAAGLGDPVRPGARHAVAQLRARGWRVGILSGDDPAVVAAVGRELDIAPEDCVGGASPEEKQHVVQRDSARTPVVMVGDGVNDAAAIAAAAVGVGVHGGAEACLATADIYLTTPGLDSLVRLTDGAARTMRVIRRNIAFSLVYNVIGATLAMTGVLDPLIAAILMPLSSLTVVLASWRGHTFQEGVTT